MSDKILLIRSKDRTSNSTSSSDFKLDLLKVIEEKSVWKLKSATIINSFYNVNGNNNIIYFNENSTDKTATITSGFYDTSSISNAVKSALDTASGGFATYTVSYSAVTGKITIASTQNFSLLYGTNPNAGSRYLLGYDATDTTAATSAAGNNIVDLSYPKGLNISINGISGYRNASNWQRGSIYIPLTVNSLEVEVFQQAEDDNDMFLDFDRSTKQLEVKLYDSDNNALDLNGTEWEILMKKIL